MGLYSKVYFIF